MIKNDGELTVTMEKIKDLKWSLTVELTEVPADFREGILKQRRNLIVELEAEVDEYLRRKRSQALDQLTSEAQKLGLGY